MELLILARTEQPLLEISSSPEEMFAAYCERWYRFVSESLRPWWKRLRGRPPVQAHVIGERTVRSAVAAAGGRVLAMVDTDEHRRRSRASLRFVIVKD